MYKGMTSVLYEGLMHDLLRSSMRGKAKRFHWGKKG